MTDREQIIAELQYMKRDVLEDSDNDITLNKAIALLKEQPEIVRCLDCHYHDAGQNESEGWNRCRLHRIPTNDDEFCSWGVMEE